MPDNKIKANNPPIKPPLSLKRLDFNKRTNKIKLVALRLEIFKKVNGDKGLINIGNFLVIYTIKYFKKSVKKKAPIEPFFYFEYIY